MALDGIIQVTKGIFDRLKRDGVADAIKAKYWSNQVSDPSKKRAIWKNRAAKGTQTPYVVYQVLTDTLIEQSTGSGQAATVAGQLVAGADQAIQHRQAQVAFNCITKKEPGKDETAAIFAAEKVDAAMTNGKLCFSTGTRFITLTRQPDIETSDDDENVVIVLQYQIDYEIIINMTRQLA